MKSLTLATLTAAALFMSASAHAASPTENCPYLGNWVNAPLNACVDIRNTGGDHNVVQSQPTFSNVVNVVDKQ